MLEMTDHEESSFVTLTYADDKLPEGGNLVPKDLQDWLKRIRKAVEPKRLRYFACGEYGDRTWRPHYHVALFGYPSCLRGGTQRFRDGRVCCSPCDLLGRSWGLGFVFNGRLEMSSAQYVAGYVVKKMTAEKDERLQGRHPEFCRMSMKPGLGAGAMDEVASVLMQFDLVDTQGDVPSALRHGGRLMPLGRYLRRKLREKVGRDPAAPAVVQAELENSLRPVYEACRVVAPNNADLRRALFSAFLAELDEGRAGASVAKYQTKRRDL